MDSNAFRDDRIREIEAALAELGFTTMQMVISLEKLGVKGKPGDPDYCIMARYLRTRVSSPDLVVCGNNGEFINFAVPGHRCPCFYRTSQVFQTLVQNFDRGCYFTLIDSE